VARVKSRLLVTRGGRSQRRPLSPNTWYKLFDQAYISISSISNRDLTGNRIDSHEINSKNLSCSGTAHTNRLDAREHDAVARMTIGGMKRKALWGSYGGSEVRQRSPISRKHGSHGLTFPLSIKDILIGKPYRQHASLGSLLKRY